MGLEDLNRRLSSTGPLGPLPSPTPASRGVGVKNIPANDKPAPQPPALRFTAHPSSPSRGEELKEGAKKVEVPVRKKAQEPVGEPKKELNLKLIDFSKYSHVNVGSRRKFRYGMNKFLKGSISHAMRRAKIIDKLMDSTVSGKITKHGFNRAVRDAHGEGLISRGEMNRMRGSARSFN